MKLISFILAMFACCVVMDDGKTAEGVVMINRPNEQVVASNCSIDFVMERIGELQAECRTNVVIKQPNRLRQYHHRVNVRITLGNPAHASIVGQCWMPELAIRGATNIVIDCQ